MTAAAERTVTFGSCFYRWTARLLSCLGSSAAQGIGGRVIAPLQVGPAYVGRVRTSAPTGDLEAALSLGGGMRATRAPSSGPSGHLPPWRGKAFRRPQGPLLRRKTAPKRWLGKARRKTESPHPASPGTSFYKGAWAGGASPSPTAIFAPVALAQQTKAQSWNRSSGNFCKPRAQWPGRNRGGHSDFARRKVSAWSKG